MRRIIFRYIISAFIFAVGMFYCGLYAGMNRKQVLYISSYHPGFPTFFQQVNGIRSVFSGKNIVLDIEFMDTKRFPERETVDSFHRMLKEKMGKLPGYDAVIVADDAALRYAISREDKLFKGIPVFFCGINDLDIVKQIEKAGRMKGTVEAVSMKETLLLIKQVFPLRKTLAVISDSTIPGQSDFSFFMNEQSGMDFDLRILSLERLSFDELNSELDALGNDSVILLLAAYTDRNGSTRLFADEFEQIMLHAKVPVFHLYEHGLGAGIFGGKIISHYEQGRTAAGMVLRYFEGTPFSDIEIIHESPNRYMFDYNQLRKFKVGMSDLPEGSLVVNKPLSIIELHPFVALAVMVSTVFMLIIILIQFLQRNSLKKEVARRTAELSESRERLTMAMENAEQVFWDWNLVTDNLVITRNNEIMSVVNNNITIRTGREWINLIHPDDMATAAENLRRHLNGEVPFYENLYRSRTVDLTWKWFISRGKVIERNAQGKAVRMTGISTDVTRLKEIENEITRSRGMLKLILDTIPLGVFWKGNDLRYMGCNNLFAQLAALGSPEEIIGKRDSDLIWKDQAETHERIDMEVLQTGKKKNFYEEEMINPAGERIYMRKLKAPLTGTNGEVIGLLGLQEDITEAKRLREQRVRMQKLESVGILAGGLAHDFNNMLMGISGSLSVLHLLEKDEKKLHWIAQAEKSCATAAEVTSRLITFARGGDPVMKPVDGAGIFSSVIEIDNSGYDLQVTSDLQGDLPPITADERQIGQVLRNLLENAREAAGSGGTIHVRYSKAGKSAVVKSGLKDGTYVQLSVRDSGTGIDSDIIGKIFDPYFSTKDMGAQKGQGLGLTVCHSIVRNHGGAISVESKAGEGTVFTVLLPAAEY